MKVTLALLLLATTINAIPVSLRFIFTPKQFYNENVNEDNSNVQQVSDLVMESRMDQQRQSPFTFVEPMMEQPRPFAFAQAQMAIVPGPALVSADLPPQSMQRRMDADEELLSQMPYSPQRRMDDAEPHLIPQGMPMIHVNGEINQPMPFLIQMPMTSDRSDQEQQQLPQQAQLQLQQPISLNHGDAIPIPLAMPVQSSPIQFRAMPIMAPMPREDMEKDHLGFEEPEVDDIQDREEVTDEDDSELDEVPPPVNGERRKILVIESAARLRPVIVDSLQTVMQLFNAVAPEMQPPTTTPTPETPQVNASARADVEKLAQKLDRSLESLTLQVADALGTLTAHAKQLLPMLLKNNNTIKGIVDEEKPEARSDDQNEIKTDIPVEAQVSPQNLTETVSRYVQLNSDEFRRTWKHFLHHYWTYVQKIFETAQGN